MSDKRLVDLMRLAVTAASKSVAEDEGSRPKVGAVLATANGEFLLESHRGEIPGAHAEFALLEKAREKGVDTRGCVLLTTLEPCTQRGSGKIPCAERVVAAKPAAVFIGTLDPNPNISGRGEIFLSFHLDEVGRFPPDLVRELKKINEAFFAHYRESHGPSTSIYASQGPDLNTQFPKPRLSDDRNQLLQQTLDLVSGSNGDVWIQAGDLSWWREAQVAYLGARLDDRAIQIVSRPTEAASPEYQQALSAARAIGANVVERSRQHGNAVQGTLVAAHTPSAAMVMIDRRGALLLRSPDDEGLLEVLSKTFDQELAEVLDVGSAKEIEPRIEPISGPELIESLRQHVPQYRDSTIACADLEIDRLRPMTRYLERFKMFRGALLDAIQIRHPHIGSSARIVGSPWPITPPVVEKQRDGTCVIIDGTHRAYEQRERNQVSFPALVVEGVQESLPATPLSSWDEVAVYSTKLPRERRYEDYKPALFRPIRQAFESLAAS